MSWRLSGMRAWIIQRLSAIYIAIFLVIIGITLLFNGIPDNYEGWHQLWSRPLLNLGMMAFIIAILLHAWVGTRDVIIDYIHPFAARLTMLSFVAISFMICGLWAGSVLINVL